MERVSKELAIELKKAGYEVPCRVYYKLDEDDIPPGPYYNWNEYPDMYSAPYLDEVIDWLDTKGLHLMQMPEGNDGVVSFYSFVIVVGKISYTQKVDEIFTTRTAAKIAGITKSLELINHK